MNKTNYNTTKRLAYAGFIVAAILAFIGMFRDAELTGLGILCGMFLTPTAYHAGRKAFGREGGYNEAGNTER